MNKYEFFHTYLPHSESKECSHKMKSMLTLPSSDTNQLDADQSTPRYNGLDLDAIQLNSKMIKARKNEKIDIARKAIGDGFEQSKLLEKARKSSKKN